MENSPLLKVKKTPANGTYIRNICCREFLIPAMSSGFSGACEQLTISEMLRQYMCHIYSMDRFTLGSFISEPHARQERVRNTNLGGLACF